MTNVIDKNMLYFYCVTQCFSLSLITHKLKLEYNKLYISISLNAMGPGFDVLVLICNPAVIYVVWANSGPSGPILTFFGT